MGFLTFLDKLSPANWSTIAYINREFPQPVERLDTATGTKPTVSVYEAIRRTVLDKHSFLRVLCASVFHFSGADR
jgi:hypothetical protein